MSGLTEWVDMMLESRGFVRRAHNVRLPEPWWMLYDSLYDNISTRPVMEIDQINGGDLRIFVWHPLNTQDVIHEITDHAERCLFMKALGLADE